VRPSSFRSLAIVSPVWSPHTAAVGHTRALAKQWPQTVRIETIAGQLSTHGRDDNSLFSLPRYFFPLRKREEEMRYQRDNGAGPGFFFFLIGLALVMVWLTQPL
jgi:hypothetical protein